MMKISCPGKPISLPQSLLWPFAIQNSRLLPQSRIFKGQVSSILKPEFINETSRNSASIMTHKPAH